MENKKVKYTEEVSPGETREAEDRAQSTNQHKKQFRHRGRKSPAQKAPQQQRENENRPTPTNFILNRRSAKHREATRPTWVVENSHTRRSALTGDEAYRQQRGANRPGVRPSKGWGQGLLVSTSCPGDTDQRRLGHAPCTPYPPHPLSQEALEQGPHKHEGLNRETQTGAAGTSGGASPGQGEGVSGVAAGAHSGLGSSGGRDGGRTAQKKTETVPFLCQVTGVSGGLGEKFTVGPWRIKQTKAVFREGWGPGSGRSMGRAR